MASGPITSWEIDGKTMETVTDFIFLVSKITQDGDCSHGIKRHLLLGWKTMTNLDSILKSRDIICLQRSVYSKLWFFSSHVWMWESDHKESWAPKNWCFWTVVLEKTLESLLDCKELSVLNIHWKDWCWSWNFNTLANWCEVLTHWKIPWRWERLKAGEEGDDREWDGRMASLTQWIWVWACSGSWWWTGNPDVI